MTHLEKLFFLKMGTSRNGWGNYYNITNYSDDSLKKKGEIVGKFIEEVAPKTAWDLGANNGLFSRGGFAPGCDDRCKRH